MIQFVLLPGLSGIDLVLAQFTAPIGLATLEVLGVLSRNEFVVVVVVVVAVANHNETNCVEIVTNIKCILAAT